MSEFENPFENIDEELARFTAGDGRGVLDRFTSILWDMGEKLGYNKDVPDARLLRFLGCALYEVPGGQEFRVFFTDGVGNPIPEWELRGLHAYLGKSLFEKPLVVLQQPPDLSDPEV